MDIAYTRGWDWLARVPPAAAPWYRRVVDDFEKAHATRRVLGACALLGATDYADITPALLDRLFEGASQAKRYQLRDGLRPFLASPYAAEDTRLAAREKYGLDYEKPRRYTWDDVLSALPYAQRPLALKLCDAWRAQANAPKQPRCTACRRGVVLALRAAPAATAAELRGLRCQGKINQAILEAAGLTEEERRAALDEVQLAIELAGHPAAEPTAETDPLYCAWVDEAVKNEQYRALSTNSQGLTLYWGRRVIPPHAQSWSEVTQGRVRELVRQARGVTDKGKTRAGDAQLRYALYMMPVDHLDLTQYWEPVSPLAPHVGARQICQAPPRAILPSGELDPRYCKEEPGLTCFQELLPDWHTEDGLGGVDYASQRALIREQATWATQYPGLFKTRGRECYTQAELRAIRQARDSAPVETDYARDVVRCAFSRLVLELGAYELEPASLAHVGSIIGEAVRDAARQPFRRPKRRELKQEEEE